MLDNLGYWVDILHLDMEYHRWDREYLDMVEQPTTTTGPIPVLNLTKEKQNDIELLGFQLWNMSKPRTDGTDVQICWILVQTSKIVSIKLEKCIVERIQLVFVKLQAKKKVISPWEIVVRKKSRHKKRSNVVAAEAAAVIVVVVDDKWRIDRMRQRSQKNMQETIGFFYFL
jgi:hypothetical protein